MGYFAFAVAAVARSNAHDRAVVYRQLGALHFHFAYGAYLGVAGGIVALFAAGGLRRNEIVHGRSARRVAALVLAAGLLISFLLPWERFAAIQRTTFLGIQSPAAVLAAVVICAAAVWGGARPNAGRLVLSGTAVLLTSAAVSEFTLGVVHLYGAWVALGLILAFAAIVLADGASTLSGQPRFGRHATAALAVVALFLTALFLPWLKVCYPTGSDLGPYSGRCLTTNGRATISGSTAALLSLLVVLVLLTPRRFLPSAVELAVGTALFVATLGFELVPTGSVGLHFGYGSVVGFSAAALLLVMVARSSTSTDARVEPIGCPSRANRCLLRLPRDRRRAVVGCAASTRAV